MNSLYCYQYRECHECSIYDGHHHLLSFSFIRHGWIVSGFAADVNQFFSCGGDISSCCHRYVMMAAIGPCLPQKKRFFVWAAWDAGFYLSDFCGPLAPFVVHGNWFYLL